MLLLLYDCLVASPLEGNRVSKSALLLPALLCFNCTLHLFACLLAFVVILVIVVVFVVVFVVITILLAM